MNAHYIVYLSAQILSFLSVICWMIGLVIMGKEFFREFRGTHYTIEHAGRFDASVDPDIEFSETDRYRKWQAKKNIRIRKGARLFFAGITLQLVLFVVQKVID